jgi:hypothetical protein
VTKVIWWENSLQKCWTTKKINLTNCIIGITDYLLIWWISIMKCLLQWHGIHKTRWFSWSSFSILNDVVKMLLGALGLHTWGMRVPFKVRVEQLQCLRCERCPAFPLLGWFNTNEFSEMILSTLISETWPPCNFIRCTETRMEKCMPMEYTYFPHPFFAVLHNSLALVFIHFN